MPYFPFVSDDLVIGPDGELTVEGEALRARLAKLRGRYRLRGDGTGFVILERVGRSYESSGRVLMSGEVAGPNTMLEIVDAISHNAWRGELVVSNGEDTRGLVFDRGAFRLRLLVTILNLTNRRGVLFKLLFDYGTPLICGFDRFSQASDVGICQL